MGGRRWLLVVIAGAALLLLAGRVIAEVYTDYLWYAALGSAEIWRAKYVALTVLRLLCGTVASLFVFANLYAVRQSVVSLVLPRRIGNLDIGEEVPRRQLSWTAGALSLLIGVILAWSQRDWSRFLGASAGVPFGETDPYFAADLSFFVFRLPLELSLFTWTMTMVLVVIGLVVLLYALTPSLRWEQGGLYVSGYVRRHLVMLAGALLLVLAWHYRLEMYTVLGRGSAPDGAFTALDHKVTIPASLVMALVALGAGLVVLWSGWTGQMRLAFAALTGVIVAALIARQIAPFVARRMMATDAVVRERPYEGIRASHTRRAFNVDGITRDHPGLVFNSLAEAAPHVPLWDAAALERSAERGTGTVGWFATDSGIVAAMPADTLTGTPLIHLAGTADNGGEVIRIMPARERLALRTIVGADSTARPITVVDSLRRIAAPSLESASSRIAHALSMQNVRLMGEATGPAPKLVTRRDVRDRVRALAPFFAQGSSIAPLWMSDSLLWAVELYASSATYPLSRRMVIAGEERAYFQHSATALVNAATGRVVLVADSALNPIAATWRQRFPGLFRRATEFPEGLLRQLPPARDGALAQATAFGRYGARDEASTPRHLPTDEGPDSALAGTPAPVIAFPALGTTGYVLPLLDRSERIVGVIVALGGQTHRTAWIPAPEPGQMWIEAIDRLRAADTLGGATMLVRGFVRTVPVAGRVVLVQPRYDWRGAATPRLLYVSSAMGDTVRSARTLLALAGRFPDTTRSTPADFRRTVQRLYDDMRRAIARGDWAAYGRAFDALGALLGQGQR
ncbi:MAG TPA: UPF0182 family protein [Gemmatimonadaceae bacterium]|nr:UPF0182 family protein [Gemmatimonadaceae bacterium]